MPTIQGFANQQFQDLGVNRPIQPLRPSVIPRLGGGRSGAITITPQGTDDLQLQLALEEQRRQQDTGILGDVTTGLSVGNAGLAFADKAIGAGSGLAGLLGSATTAAVPAAQSLGAGLLGASEIIGLGTSALGAGGALAGGTAAAGAGAGGVAAAGAGTAAAGGLAGLLPALGPLALLGAGALFFDDIKDFFDDLF